MKASATSDLTVGGAHLAAQAFRAGPVDECRLFVWRIAGPSHAGILPSPVRGPRRVADHVAPGFSGGALSARPRARLGSVVTLEDVILVAIKAHRLARGAPARTSHVPGTDAVPG